MNSKKKFWISVARILKFLAVYMIFNIVAVAVMGYFEGGHQHTAVFIEVANQSSQSIRVICSNGENAELKKTVAARSGMSFQALAAGDDRQNLRVSLYMKGDQKPAFQWTSNVEDIPENTTLLRNPI